MPLPSAWSGSAARFLSAEPKGVDARLTPLVALLQDALRRAPQARPVWVVLDWRLLRHGRRIDAVIATDRAVLAVRFCPGVSAFGAADRRAAEDAALDLADFHAGSRLVPILPVVLIPNGVRPRQQFPLPFGGAAAALDATRLTLPGVLAQTARFPSIGLDGAAWAASPYAPVAGLLDAASMLYAQHGVSRLRLAAAGPEQMRRTQAALRRLLDQAASRGGNTVIFLTGTPGAGKTLCGLDLAFAPAAPATFLTGNPSLVHVLREALTRDAVAKQLDRRAAQRRMEAVIQALPHFRDHHVATGAAPAEPVVIVDEAQRCWSRAHAIRKTRNHAVKLTDSEPGHLLDIMARRPGGVVMLCLVGGGQEIHDGEGGLAAWAEALASRPDWAVAAPPGAIPAHAVDPDLHLEIPVRAVRAPAASAWVDAMLADAPERAAEIARQAGDIPFEVTRSLTAMRRALRPRGNRTAGLLASSTARRLRAEGLGAVLPHQDDDAVARWFLDRWPDIRSGDALEVVGTEFAVQGLELDRVGVCWDGDLIRGPTCWQARRFRATRWTAASPVAHAHRLNAYRVLLTRARHGTIIWVPQGDAADPTRDPAWYDAIAGYLRDCGATALDEAASVEQDAAPSEPALL